VNSSRWKS